MKNLLVPKVRSKGLSGYSISDNIYGISNNSLVLGIHGRNISNRTIKSVCLTFKNQLSGFIYNKITYIISDSKNCEIIPSNNEPINTSFYLIFL